VEGGSGKAVRGGNALSHSPFQLETPHSDPAKVEGGKEGQRDAGKGGIADFKPHLFQV